MTSLDIILTCDRLIHNIRSSPIWVDFAVSITWESRHSLSTDGLNPARVPF